MSYMDDSDEDLSLPRAGQPIAGSSRARGTRQPSLLSEGSRMASGSGGRVAGSVGMGTDDMSSMRGMSALGGSRYAFGDDASSARDVEMDTDGGTIMGDPHRDPLATGASLGDGHENEDDEDLDDVKRLGKAWVRERGTQMILRWEGDLMDAVFDKLEQQQKLVTLLRSDPQTSEEEHFKLVLVMTEMERVKYLVRSYVRTRLAKIEKFSHHLVLSPELHNHLSGAELSHARRYNELLHTHYQHSVLDSLPEWLRKMDDKFSDGTDMIPRPNPNVPVLIYCRRDCGGLTLPDGEVAELEAGSSHLVKYSLVENWINLGWAEII